MVFLKRAINVVIFLIPLLALFALVFTFFSLGLSVVESGLFSSAPAIAVILFLILVSGLVVLKTLRPVLEGRMVYAQFKGIGLVGYFADLFISLAVLTLIGFFTLAIFNDNPPQLFPFDDSGATYTLAQNGGLYYLEYSSTSNKNTRFDCSIGSNGFKTCQNIVDNKVETMVGNSPVDLEPLIGKPLKVKGEFVYTSKQCIAGNCKDIGDYTAVNITSIEPN